MGREHIHACYKYMIYEFLTDLMRVSELNGMNVVKQPRTEAYLCMNVSLLCFYVCTAARDIFHEISVLPELSKMLNFYCTFVILV